MQKHTLKLNVRYTEQLGALLCLFLGYNERPMRYFSGDAGPGWQNFAPLFKVKFIFSNSTNWKESQGLSCRPKNFCVRPGILQN